AVRFSSSFILIHGENVSAKGRTHHETVQGPSDGWSRYKPWLRQCPLMSAKTFEMANGGGGGERLRGRQYPGVTRLEGGEASGCHTAWPVPAFLPVASRDGALGLRIATPALATKFS